MNRKVGVILSYFLMALNVLSTLLITPFIVRTLGQGEYGVYKLSASITAYLLLLDLGIGNAIVKYVSKFRAKGDKDSENKFLGLVTLIYSIIGVFCIIIGFALFLVFPVAFSNGLTSEEISLGQTLLTFTMINACVTLATVPFTNTLIAYEKFAVSKTASIVEILLRIIFYIISLKMGFGSVGIVVTNLLLNVIGKLFYICYCFWALKIRPKIHGIEKSFLKEIFGYTFLVLLQMIATQINASLDMILIGALVVSSSAILAVYGIGSQIVSYFQSIGSAFTSVTMPGIVFLCEKENTNSEDLTNEMVKIGRFVTLVLGIILVGFALFGKQFISLWAGENYVDGYYVALLLMIAYFFVYPQAPGSQILWSKNIHKEISIIKLGIVLANIALTVILIRWNPLIGATIGTFVSLMLGDVILSNVVYKKKLGISIKRLYIDTFKGIIPSLLISFGCGFAFSLLNIQGWIGLVFDICLVLLVYGICLLLFGFNTYEKNLVKRLLGKIFRKKRI